MKADKETRLIDNMSTHLYKVTFENGDVEYYFDYKPATHKYIKIQDGVHIGVTKIEKVK